MPGDMSLKTAWKCYFRFFFLNIALWIVYAISRNVFGSNAWELLIWVPIAFYFYSGIWLNRHVLRSLPIEYHPMYNTINNIHRIKQSFMLLWFFKYPYLLYQLWSVKTI